jgi:hypothetical protein
MSARVCLRVYVCACMSARVCVSAWSVLILLYLTTIQLRRKLTEAVNAVAGEEKALFERSTPTPKEDKKGGKEKENKKNDKDSDGEKQQDDTTGKEVVKADEEKKEGEEITEGEPEFVFKKCIHDVCLPPSGIEPDPIMYPIPPRPPLPPSKVFPSPLFSLSC